MLKLQRRKQEIESYSLREREKKVLEQMYFLSGKGDGDLYMPGFVHAASKRLGYSVVDVEKTIKVLEELNLISENLNNRQKLNERGRNYVSLHSKRGLS